MPTSVLLDSFSDLDLLQAEEIGVNLLMQTVEFAGQVWLSNDEVPPELLVSALRAGTPLPVNTPVSVAAYTITLERMLTRSDHVLAIHPTQAVVGVLEVAKEAARTFPGRVTICGIETLSVSLALLGERAVAWLRQGLSPSEVAERIEAAGKQLHTILAVETTEFARAVAAERLTSPDDTGLLIYGVGGTARPQGQFAVPEVGEKMMQQWLFRLSRQHPGARLATFHYAAQERVERLRQYADRLGLKLYWSVTLGLVLEAQLGPGTYGFVLDPLSG